MRSLVSVGSLRVVATGLAVASIDETGRVAWCIGSQVFVDGTCVLRRDGVRELDFAGDRLLIRTAKTIFLYDVSSESETVVATIGDRSPQGDVYASFDNISMLEDIAFTATLPDGRRTLIIRDRQVLTTGGKLGDNSVGDFRVSRLGLCAGVVTTIGGRPTLLHAQADLLALGDPGPFVPLWQAPAVASEVSFAAVTQPDGDDALVATAMGFGSTVIARGRFADLVACAGDGVLGVAAVQGNQLWVGVFGNQLPLAGASIAPLSAGDRTDSGEVVRSLRPVKLGADGTLLLTATLDEGTPALLTLHDLFGWYQPF